MRHPKGRRDGCLCRPFGMYTHACHVHPLRHRRGVVIALTRVVRVAQQSVIVVGVVLRADDGGRGMRVTLHRVRRCGTVAIDERAARLADAEAEGDPRAAKIAALGTVAGTAAVFATVRSVSVATARQQATAVYRKAGLGGRHDLAAFFLEDLLADRTGG